MLWFIISYLIQNVRKQNLTRPIQQENPQNKLLTVSRVYCVWILCEQFLNKLGSKLTFSAGQKWRHDKKLVWTLLLNKSLFYQLSVWPTVQTGLSSNSDKQWRPTHYMNWSIVGLNVLVWNDCMLHIHQLLKSGYELFLKMCCLTPLNSPWGRGEQIGPCRWSIVAQEQQLCLLAEAVDHKNDSRVFTKQQWGIFAGLTGAPS